MLYTLRLLDTSTPSCFGLVSLQEAWVHLAKEAPSCIAHLDGAVLPLTVTARLGLPTGPDGVARELLVVGTANGDCMFVDITAGGSSVLRWVGCGSWGL